MRPCAGDRIPATDLSLSIRWNCLIRPLIEDILKKGIALLIVDWTTNVQLAQLRFRTISRDAPRICGTHIVATKKKTCRFIYRDALWYGGDMIGIGVSSFSHFGGVNFHYAHNFEEYVRILNEVSSADLSRRFTDTTKWTTGLRPTFIGRPGRDFQTSSRRAHDPENRGSFGSRAIDDLSRAEAKQRHDDRIPPFLRFRTSKGSALVWRSTDERRRPAPSCPRRFEEGLVAGAGRRSPQARGWAFGHQLRKHLSLHLRSDRSHQRLQLAPPSAPRARANAASEVAAAAVPQASSKPGFPSLSARLRPPIARPPDIGKPTSFSLPNTARPSSPFTIVTAG